MGQTYFPVKIAVERNINLIMYGDAQEKAGDGDLWNEEQLIHLYSYENKDKLFFGGVKYRYKKMELGFRLKSIFTT